MKDYNFFAAYRKKGGGIDVRSPFFAGAVIVFLCAAAALGMIVWNLILASRISLIQAETGRLQQSEDFTEANRLQSSLDIMQRYDSSAETVLTSLDAAQILGTERLNRLFGGVPVNVTITTLSMDAATLTLSCNLPDRKAAAELILGLRDTGLFSDITLTSVTTNQDGNGSVASLTGVMKAGDEQ